MTFHSSISTWFIEIHTLASQISYITGKDDINPLIYSKSNQPGPNWSLFMMRRSCKNSGPGKTCWIYVYIQSNCEPQAFQPTFSNWRNVM